MYMAGLVSVCPCSTVWPLMTSQTNYITSTGAYALIDPRTLADSKSSLQPRMKTLIEPAMASLPMSII